VGDGSKPDAPHRHVGDTAPMQMPDELAGRPITGIVRMLFAIAAVGSTALVLNQLLNLQLLVGVVFIENRYLFLLAATLLPLIFLVFPAHKDTKRPTPWYDGLIAFVAFALLVWFAVQAERILSEGWEYGAPTIAKLFAAAVALLILEALRRTSGWPMAVIVATVSRCPR
jgi:TRAP-type uncharacterized transport system, fused permease components